MRRAGAAAGLHARRRNPENRNAKNDLRLDSPLRNMYRA